MSTAAIQHLQALLDQTFKNEPHRILEAGCGSFTHVVIPGENHITGIDISQEQLDKNSKLNEKIKADIQSYSLPENMYDLIICWDVMEHLPFPAQALQNFKKAINQTGLIILALPNVYSLKGLITRFTPHWFHVFVYKYIFNKKDAGQPGCAPFPTFLKFEIAPRALLKFANENNFEVVFLETEDRFPRIIREDKRYLYLAYVACSHLLKIISLGTLGGINNTDFICVLRRKPA
ncbi:MAG: class I SAM-dependent methyltransferase [Gammaproteobacteria bacterium]|nr:class I SAM-dependent methyltransferase [Gammaproteobacteria bacterium]MDH5652369.1 class I SAM-dependent methyltransferase [Gammaproteobacteria bacterium]